MSVHPTYSSPAPHGALYDHRHGYYDAAPAAHPGYGYASTSQFARHPYNAPYPGYDAGYPDIRFQAHMGMNPDSSRKRRGNLPKDATNYMKDWYNKHKDSPYPTEDQKLDMCERTGLSISQVSCSYPFSFPLWLTPPPCARQSATVICQLSTLSTNRTNHRC
jgi:hypothetical protein